MPNTKNRQLEIKIAKKGGENTLYLHTEEIAI